MLRKLFSTCFSVLFVVVFLITLILFGLNSGILNVNNFKSAFVKADFYNQIFDKGITYFLQGMTGQGSTGLGPISTDNITSTIKKSIPTDWLEKHVNNIFDQTFSFITGKSNSINIIIPVSEIKKSLSDNLSSTLKTKIDKLPNCTSDQMKQFNSQDTGNSFNFECKPSNMNTADLENSMLDGITGKDGLITKLPDQYNLGEIMSKGNFLSEVKRFVDLFRIGMWISLGISFILFAIIVLMNMKYIPGMLKWLTIPLLIVSIIALALGGIGYLTINSLVGGFTISLPNEFKVIIFDLIKSLTGNIFFGFELNAGIIFVISIVTLIVAISMQRKNPPKTV